MHIVLNQGDVCHNASSSLCIACLLISGWQLTVLTLYKRVGKHAGKQPAFCYNDNSNLCSAILFISHDR